MAVVLAVTSNILNKSDLPLAMDLLPETTADIPEDTDTIPTRKRTWGAKLAVACHMST